MTLIETAAASLANGWLKLYRQAPQVTSITTALISLILAVVAFVTQRSALEAELTKRLENLGYAKQVQALDDTRASLQNLTAFVDNERKQLRLSEETLQALKTEHAHLKPLVETDRKAVDALFAAQEVRNQAALSTERWIGFGFGVVSSLVASFIWALGAFFVRRRNSEPAA